MPSSPSVFVSMAVSLSVSNSANMALASSKVTWGSGDNEALPPDGAVFLTWAEVVLWKVLVLLSSLLTTESELGLQ